MEMVQPTALGMNLDVAPGMAPPPPGHANANDYGKPAQQYGMTPQPANAYGQQQA